MQIVVQIVQIFTAVILSGLILLQNSKGGLGTAFGGGGEFRSKRGAEQIIFRATIVFAVLFLIMSIISILVKG